MPDWSEQNMDKFFQEGAQRYDFTYQPEAWNAMESLLERDRRRRLLWWWLVGLTMGLILLSGAWFFIQGVNADNTKPLQSFHIAIPYGITNIDTTTQLINKDAKVIHGRTNKPELQGSNAKTNILPEKFQLQDKRNKYFNLQKKNTKFSLPQVSIPEKADGGITEQQNPLPTKKAEIIPSQMIDTTDRAYDRRAIAIKAIPTLTIKPHAGFPPAIAVSGPVAPEDSGRKLPLVISIGGGAVWSSAGLDDFTRHSWRAGLAIEFQPWKRYSLSTGLFYTKLFYRAGEGDYQVYGDWLPEPVKLKSTDAVCKIIELPLLFHYYPKGYDRPGFSYSAGLISYIMAAEYYHYHYDPPDDTLPQWWGAHYENHHWLSVGHLGMRYQQPLGDRMAVSIAPFVQIPLGGVGYGKVKLFNFGADVRLHYKF